MALSTKLPFLFSTKLVNLYSLWTHGVWERFIHSLKILMTVGGGGSGKVLSAVVVVVVVVKVGVALLW